MTALRRVGRRTIIVTGKGFGAGGSESVMGEEEQGLGRHEGEARRQRPGGPAHLCASSSHSNAMMVSWGMLSAPNARRE